MESRDEKISVVVPVYNVSKYLEKCLDSLIMQTYTNLEIILVDDGSTDGSSEICDRYALIDKRVNVVHKENGGESSARNAGLEYVSGEWISFVDSDDWMDINSYECIMNMRDVNNYDIVSFAFYREGRRKSITIHPYSSDQCIDNKSILKKIQLSTLDKEFNPIERIWATGYLWDKLIRSSLIKDNNIRFRTELKAQEDVFFMFELYQYVNKIKYIDCPLYHYRYNPDSATTRYTPNRVDIDINLYRMLKAFASDHELDSQFEDALNSRIVMNLFACMYRCFFNKKNTKSFKNKYLELKDALDIEIIKNAFTNVNRDYLNITGKFITLTRKKNAWLMYIGYRIIVVKDYFRGI